MPNGGQKKWNIWGREGVIFLMSERSFFEVVISHIIHMWGPHFLVFGRVGIGSLFRVIFGYPLDQSRMGVEICKTDGRSRRTGRNRLGTYILVYGGVKLAKLGSLFRVKMGSFFWCLRGHFFEVGRGPNSCHRRSFFHAIWRSKKVNYSSSKMGQVGVNFS